MPKYTFRQYETTTHIVQFEADSLEHAKELMDEVFDVDDLPESEKFWKNGQTDWDEPTEVVGNGVVDLSAINSDDDYEEDN
jgi:hypothetical protein